MAYTHKAIKAARRRRLLLESGAVATDQYWDNVSLLLDMAGVDDATEMTDLSSNTHAITFVNQAKLSTEQSKFVAPSLELDGTNDIITVPDHASFDLGSGDWTIEMHVRWRTMASTTPAALFAKWQSSGQRSYVWRKSTTADTFDFVWTTTGVGSSGLVTWPGTVAAGQWYHLAVVRSGTDLLFFIDGNEKTPTGTVDAAVFHNGNESIQIGAYSTGADPIWDIDGWIDNVRVTKGVARYTASFSAPTAEYPTSGPAA
jgi:hypothetical protein